MPPSGGVESSTACRWPNEHCLEFFVREIEKSGSAIEAVFIAALPLMNFRQNKTRTRRAKFLFFMVAREGIEPPTRGFSIPENKTTTTHHKIKQHIYHIVDNFLFYVALWITALFYGSVPHQCPMKKGIQVSLGLHLLVACTTNQLCVCFAPSAGFALRAHMLDSIIKSFFRWIKYHRLGWFIVICFYFNWQD